MIQLIELPDGSLLIKVIDKEEFAELAAKELNDERIYLCDMLESARYIGNNWFVPFELGLTEIPAIAYGAIYENDDAEEPNDYEKLWGYPNYMITSYLDELKENGEVIFNNIN